MRTQVKVKARARAEFAAKRALSDIQRNALELLTRCVNDHGRQPPTPTAENRLREYWSIWSGTQELRSAGKEHGPS